MKVLVIGDTSLELCTKTTNRFGNCLLISKENYSETLKSGVYFTAIGDLDFDQIKTLACTFDRVIFEPDLPWKNLDERTSCEILLNHLSNFIEIENFSRLELNCFVEQNTNRLFDNPTVWSFGCSTTYGDGLENDALTYGSLVAQELNMPWQKIAYPSTSTIWAQDHIFASDLQTGDIVLIGFTSAERFRSAKSLTHANNKLVRHAERHEVMYYTDEQLYLEYVLAVYRTVKYLRAKNITFIFTSFLHKSPILFDLEKNFSCYPEWCPTKKWYDFDIGNDGVHIGPLAHKYVAEQMLNQLNLLQGNINE